MDAEVKPIDREYQVALYQSISHGYITVDIMNDGKDTEFHRSMYARLSEPVTVKFAPLTDEAVIQGALQAIDAEEKRLRIDLEKRLAELRDRRRSLLALTYQPGEAA